MQAGTNFPKVRRMLLYVFPLFCIFSPTTPLFRGHIALAISHHPALSLVEVWSEIVIHLTPDKFFRRKKVDNAILEPCWPLSQALDVRSALVNKLYCTDDRSLR